MADDEAIEVAQAGEVPLVDLAHVTVSRQQLPRPPLGFAIGDRLVVRDLNLWIEQADGTEYSLTKNGEPFFPCSSPPDLDSSRVAGNRDASLPTSRVGCVWSPMATG